MFHYENEPLEEKFEVPAELPPSYNQDILVLMPRDPHTAFVYWDFRTQEAKRREQDEIPGGQYNIKIYKESKREFPPGEPVLHQEIPIIRGTRSCYFELDENYDKYFATLEFVPFFEEPVPVTQSNVIIPPKGFMAEETYKEWKSIEKIYRKFYSLVKKELRTDPTISEIFDEEELELDEIGTFEEMRKIEREEAEEIEESEELEELEELEEKKKSGESIEFREMKRLKKQGKKEKSQVSKEELEKKKIAEQERSKQESLQKEKLKRRQETIRRIINMYLERRALPGGIYAPAIPPPREPKKD